ncbi:hypothetical protein K469DRAFT_382403 [Zopfia rhizophila CBS 207.26]|uniref:Uncharacterized protein n=1 Tax=Zopfia rhizophila CBS 207.26 TaxID=1314779 RepID=A0A6A6DEW3_9PEZI|nr:hypothetical protein K469DRAFT_382403 [Zopfia rhizophila CBS 207.26]
MHRDQPMMKKFGPSTSDASMHTAVDAEVALSFSEIPYVPLLELGKKRQVYIWQCCACGCSPITIMANTCPHCGSARIHGRGGCVFNRINVRRPTKWNFGAGQTKYKCFSLGFSVASKVDSSIGSVIIWVVFRRFLNTSI